MVYPMLIKASAWEERVWRNRTKSFLPSEPFSMLKAPSPPMRVVPSYPLTPYAWFYLSDK